MKKYISLILISLLFLSSCSTPKEKKVVKNYKTAEVFEGVVRESDYFVTYTDSFNKTPLAPKVGGRITAIYKKVGDKVKSGELIATLDSTEAKTAYGSAGGVISSLEDLKISTSLAYDKQIEATREKLNQLEAGKDISDISISGADKGLEDTKNITDNQIETVKAQIEQAKLGLNTAKTQLQNTKDSFTQKEKDLYTNSKNAVSASFILANNALGFLDEIFGVTEDNKDKDDRFEDYLGAKNYSKKHELRVKIEKAIYDLKVLEKETKNLSSKEETLKKLRKVYKFFNSQLKSILSDSYSVVDDSVTSVGSLADAQINAFKKTITEFQTKNEKIILSVEGNYTLGLKGAIDNIENFDKTKKSNLDMLEKGVENAEKQIEVLNKTLEMYKAQSSGQITKVETGLSQAKKQKEIVLSQIQEAKAGIEAIKEKKRASLSEIDAKIAEARGGLNTAGVMIENGKIYSNIDGIIVKKMLDVGTVISAGMPILIVSDDFSIKLEVLVSEELSNTLKLGDIAEVKVDGIDELQKATITNIFPAKDMITKRVGVELKLENSENKIKLASYSKVYFSDLDSPKGIVIPNSALLEKFMIPGVYVLENNKAVFKKIKILKQNDDFSEVEGLKIGEKVITDGKENIFDGEEMVQ